jgi:hypothetical protein
MGNAALEELDRWGVLEEAETPVDEDGVVLPREGPVLEPLVLDRAESLSGEEAGLDVLLDL